MRLSYPKSLRLRTAKDFSKVFSHSRRLHSDFLTFRIHFNKLEHPRLGFALSRKTIKTAAQRHLIKRLIREWFRSKQHELPAVDIVITANSKVDKLKKADIYQCIDTFSQKLARSLAP